MIARGYSKIPTLFRITRCNGVLIAHIVERKVRILFIILRRLFLGDKIDYISL